MAVKGISKELHKKLYRYRVSHLDDRTIKGFKLQRHALHGPRGYLGELLVSCAIANKIAKALNRGRFDNEV